MARAELIDYKRMRVEAENDDTYIIDFMGGLNYLINGRSDNALLGFLGEMFDKHYDGDMNTVWGVSRYFVTNSYGHIFYLQSDRDQERIWIGSCTKQLREGKKMDAKTLTTRSGIDMIDQCRIEQGRYSAGFDILVKVAAVLACNIDFVTNK